MSDPLLHVDLVVLREDVTTADREALFEQAASLRDVDGVTSLGLIEAEGGGDFGLGFFFVIDSPRSLEAFGTHQRYTRFLQGGIAGAMRSFAGADARLEGPWPPAAPYAACIALLATPQTYDWQVRDAVLAWCGREGVGGLASGERQRYRGVGVTFASRMPSRPLAGFEGFGVDFIAGRYRALS